MQRGPSGTAVGLGWHDQIRAHGGPLLITARFIPGGRTALTVTSGLTRQAHPWFARWIALAAVIWATYPAGLGYIFGNRFQDDHTVAFVLAFGAALSITLMIEVVRHVRKGKARRRPPPRSSPSSPRTGCEEWTMRRTPVTSPPEPPSVDEPAGNTARE